MLLRSRWAAFHRGKEFYTSRRFAQHGALLAGVGQVSGYLKISPEMSPGKAINNIAAVLKTENPEQPFEYRFVDQEYAKEFDNEERLGKLATVFAGLAIFITCLGLFGMATYMAEQRVKEIGVRKVPGASVFALWQLLSKDFAVLVSVSISIASPVAYYFMHNWLRNYPYHTDLAWWLFIVTAIGAILITLMTVSFQAVKAAQAKTDKEPSLSVSLGLRRSFSVGAWLPKKV